MNSLRARLGDAKDALYVNPVGYAWAQRHGASVKALPEAIRSRLLLTDHDVEAVGRPLWERERSRWLRPIDFTTSPGLARRALAWPHRVSASPPVVLGDATLVGRHGAVVTREGHITLSAFADQPRILGLDGVDELERFDHQRAEPSVRLDFATSLAGRLAPNYFHWMVDQIARLQHCARIEHTSSERLQIVIPDNAPAIAQESLQLLGIDSSRVVMRRSHDHAWRVARYVHIPLPGRHIARSPASLHWLRQTYLEAVGCTSEVADRRLLILRPAGGWRHLSNREEVVEALTPYGFEVIDPGSLALTEQIRLFRRASCIVGEHGAALTNVLFAPDAALLEINAGYGGGLFAHLARLLGNPYRTVPAGSGDGHSAAVRVPALHSALEAMGVR